MTGRPEVGGKFRGMSEVIPDRPSQSVIVSFICFPGDQIFLMAKIIHLTGPFQEGQVLWFSPCPGDHSTNRSQEVLKIFFHFVYRIQASLIAK